METGRRADARRRAAVAKAGLVLLGAGAFVGGMALTRATAAGHTKQAAQPLSAPRAFVRRVHRNAISPGAIAPPQAAPPPAATATS